MSFGKPDVYIGTQLMQSTKADPRPVLAGLTIRWGNESRVDFAGASTATGELLIRDAMPAFLTVGAPVGIVDPFTSRCLFAGTIASLTATAHESIKSALRVTFSASSPLAELEKHKVVDIDWPLEESNASRYGRLAAAMPRGWTLAGPSGPTWINSGRQKYQSVDWLELAEAFCRGWLYRLHDTSSYTPGAGLTRRISFSGERSKTLPAGLPAPGTAGAWTAGAGRPATATGVAVMPERALGRGIEWEKTPDDTITDVQISTTGGAVVADGNESAEFEYLMSAYVDNTAMQDAYGYRQVKIRTAASAFNVGSIGALIQQTVAYWLDADTKWRPTSLEIPDSRVVNNTAMLSLLAVDTRHMAVVVAPELTAPVPGGIRSFVMAGTATWTGKKWTATLTLGRTLD